MDSNLKTSLWQQFGASIDMFSDAISACPDNLWTAALWEDSQDPRYGQFWSIAYHTLFFLDLYLTGSREGFAPPAPFLFDGFPEEPYSKEEIYGYLKQCRQKCQSVIEELTDEKANRLCTFSWMEPTFLELQLYNMRHVQEHAAQLSMMLGQNGVSGFDWVSKARDEAS